MEPLRLRQVLAGAGVTSLLTLMSRVLGMLRDAATAALLGMATGGVMDAFVVAFRVPNLMRRLFGEGALTASYLPVLARELKRDRQRAWRFASATLVVLAGTLAVIVLAGEIACGAIAASAPDDSQLSLLAGLLAVLLPYLLLICLIAQLAATLHALSHFAVPAAVPVVLNVVWLAAALWVAPAWGDAAHRAYVLAAAVVIAGGVQFAVLLAVLRASGFRFGWAWGESRGAVGEVFRGMAPALLGLAVMQINTLADSLIAWGFAGATIGEPIGWLGGALTYPMQQGAAASTYFAQRLYQFPVGVLGIAVATVIFPLLAGHAAGGRARRLARDLTFGLRLVLFFAAPATAGLMILAEPIVRLVFEHGAFTPDDTARASRVVFWYASGIWAYCTLSVLLRGYYALGRHALPARIGMATVAIHLVLDFLLLWPMAEAGLALATSLAASWQVVVLAVLFSRRETSLNWSLLAGSAAKIALSTGAMALATIALSRNWPMPESLAGESAAVFVPIAVAVAVYGFAAWLIGCEELKMLASAMRRQ